MAIWRHRDLEDIIGALLDSNGLTEAAILELVQQIPAESEFVDYKSRDEFKKPRGLKPWSMEQEHAKDVCGSANGRGGLLIYGVEDLAKAPAPADRMQPFDASADRHAIMEQLRQDVRAYSAPTPAFEVFAVESDLKPGCFYLVVVTPASPNAPHAVTVPNGEARKALHYYLRIPGETSHRHLLEHEVFERYQGRIRTRAQREQRLEEVWAHAQQELLAPGSHVWVAVAVIPDMPADDFLNARARKEVIEWDQSQRFPNSILQPNTGVGDYPFPAPGAIVFTNLDRPGGESVPAAINTYRQIHADGTAFAAERVSPQSIESWPVILDTDYLVDSLCAMTLHVLSWACERAGGRGTATVRAALVSRPGSSTKLDNAAGAQVHGLRQLDHHTMPVTTTSTDLAELVDTQSILRVASVAATRIVQGFGMPEPPWLTEDGEIDTRMVPRAALGYVRKWMEIHNVPSPGR
ncbi:AlbA family DNA-binding domain-containing protein [Nocardia sp. bgisy118]|uniref:AlbA family DNA-binding domain-containing protein n=1 Tax=Nocardia sp. bgisy118 TaxID=3413786 RepID=UPI003F49E75C